MKQSITSIAAYLCLLLLFTSCQKEVSQDINRQGTIELNLAPVVGSSLLDFTSSYQNSFGEQYTVQAFKFYIHKIELVKSTNELITVSNEYYLVDAADVRSLSIPLQATAGNYKAVAFTLGVDSARNVSGAQTGALDPVKGMFWTWNTGYIMAKFEGSSPVSTQPSNRFQYHIGGFKETDNVVNRIQLDFPAASIQVEENEVVKLNMEADANKWFDAVHSLQIADNAVCMTPGILAKSFAENYYNMFVIRSVE